MSDSQHFYITTTLPYVNGSPHIGHAMEFIRADVLARYYRQQGKTVAFNIGTDEHGLKVYEKAEAADKPVQDFVDEQTAVFVDFAKQLNISNTLFTRTTSTAHKKAAQKFWQACAANDDIYKKHYKAKYCVGCELEKTDSELDNGRCRFHPNQQLQIIEEENYFFRFSKYQDHLLQLYRDNPEFVRPKSRMNEIAAFVESGLKDFSISRLKSKMPWGVPVPGDSDHVMYVWFDALSNYVSAVGWPDESYKTWWPATQIAGKDNLRQQSAMWQAMLLSAGLPPSREIMINGFVRVDGQKMSKSVGNVVDPFELVSNYGVDAVRFYFTRHLSSLEDTDFSYQHFERAYNGELANDLGNLAQRLATMINKYQNGVIGTIPAPNHDEGPYHRALEHRRFDQALEHVWKMVGGVNQFIDTEQPWKVAKDGNERHLEEILSSATGDLLQVANLLQPFLPATAHTLQQQFDSGVVNPDHTLFFERKHLYTAE